MCFLFLLLLDLMHYRLMYKRVCAHVHICVCLQSEGGEFGVSTLWSQKHKLIEKRGTGEWWGDIILLSLLISGFQFMRQALKGWCLGCLSIPQTQITVLHSEPFSFLFDCPWNCMVVFVITSLPLIDISSDLLIFHEFPLCFNWTASPIACVNCSCSALKHFRVSYGDMFL